MSAIPARPNPYIILLPFLLTPIASFGFRMVNAMIAPELVAEFGLGPSALGFVTSAFFVGFGLSQLPMGVMLDRLGPRPVMLALLAVAVAGSVIFAVADHAVWLVIGRFMMGLGMAGSVMGGLKAANVWLARERVPLVNSILFGMTGVGGMIATVPLAKALEVIDWRTAVLLVSGFTAFTAVLIAICVPAQPRASGTPPTLARQVRELGGVYLSRHFWSLAPMVMLGVSGFAVYQSLWTPIWMRDVVGADRNTQAWTLFCMLAATVIGSFSFGWLAQALTRRGIDLAAPAALGISVQIALQFWLAVDPPAFAMWVWVAMGLAFGAPLALYPAIAGRFDPGLAGRVNTATNMLVFLTSFVLQWGIGFVLELFPGAEGDSYDPAGHRLALAITAALQVAAIAWWVVASATARARTVERREITR